MKHQNFIAGQFSQGGGDGSIFVLNPATGQKISEIEETSKSDMDRAVSTAVEAQKDWALRPAIERAGALRQLAAGIRQQSDLIAQTIATEQGKLLSLAKVEANFTADYFDYVAEWARRIEGEIIPSDRAGEQIFLFRKPVGVVGAILPWNFPFFLIARKVAPALLMGNSIVVKPSEETPNNAAVFADILGKTEVPAGLVNLVYGTGHRTGAALTAHEGIDMISFTGSVRTGETIMAAASRGVRKVNLELGGKAPAIVLADADVDLAVKHIADSRVLNNGQVCNCAEKVFVAHAVADEFEAKMTKTMAELELGDPMKESTDMGPLINRDAVNKVQGVLDDATSAGATVLTGGSAKDLNGGSFYEATVLTGCTDDMAVMRHETFGPVLPIARVDGVEEAIEKANASDYGLTSSIYTKSLSAALYASERLQYGETYINRENFEAMQGFHAGVKKSGIGGADGKHGVLEYTQAHVVYANG